MAAKAPLAVQKQVRFPTPVAGINTLDNVMAMGPESAFLVNNFVARPTGLEIRKGWKNWTDFGDDFLAAVQTLMYYVSPTGTVDKLFASTAEAASPIYDVTAPITAPPVALFTPGAGAFQPGEWYWVNFTTPGNSFLCIQAEGLGYYQYTASGGWVKILNGVLAGRVDFTHLGVTYPVEEMSYIFSWKSRLWFLHGTKGLVWYLPVNSVTGVAAALDLGQFMRRGGEWAFGTGWTFDGGEGMDDNLVFVSSNGDMVVYEGDDPDTAGQFKLKGTWFIGRVPAGRRGHCQYRGSIIVATEFGILDVAQLVSGKLPTDADATIGAKFNPSLATYISTTINQKYWQLLSYPGENFVYVVSPAVEAESAISIAFLMDHFTKGWSTITNFPAYCAVVYQGQMYFGTIDMVYGDVSQYQGGRIAQAFSGYKDDASLTDVAIGAEVTGFFQSGFYDFGSPTKNKRAQRVRMLGVSDGVPGYVIVVKSEYDVSSSITAPPPLSGNQSLWDVALWDQAIWAARATTFKKWFGVAGFGKKLSTAAAIRGSGFTLITDYEVTFEEGIGL